MSIGARQAHINDAVVFLEEFCGEWPWPLVAIKKTIDGKTDIEAIPLPNSEKRETIANKWIGRWNGQGYNLYFAINPLKRPLYKKADKNDVASAAWLWADLDPPESFTTERIAEWRLERRLQFKEGLPGGLPVPTWIIDSGRGFWLFWRLGAPLALDGKDGPITGRIEAYGQRIEQAFAPWADNCSNIDRIARLPGTVNHKTGDVAGVVEHNREAIYALEDFPPPTKPESTRPSPDPNAQSPPQHGEPWPEAELPERILNLIRDGVPVGERSDQFHHVVCWLHDLGWDVAQIEGLLSRYPGGIAAKYRDRLAEEIARSFAKARPKPEEAEETGPEESVR